MTFSYHRKGGLFSLVEVILLVLLLNFQHILFTNGPMYITYIWVSKSTPLAVTGPHGQLASTLFCSSKPLIIVPLHMFCRDWENHCVQQRTGAQHIRSTAWNTHMNMLKHFYLQPSLKPKHKSADTWKTIVSFSLAPCKDLITPSPHPMQMDFTCEGNQIKKMCKLLHE